MSKYFNKISKINFEESKSSNPLSFKYYDENQMVLGKTMKEHLRFATCYWHTFTWPGLDPFGGPTFNRPWMKSGNAMEMAELKLEEAFDFFSKITTPYFCFHDRDISPEGKTYVETQKNFFHIVDLMEKKMSKTGVKLLWGTANAFSHKRFMAGASTNPDPEVFAYAAAQVKDCMNATNRFGGGREVERSAAVDLHVDAQELVTVSSTHRNRHRLALVVGRPGSHMLEAFATVTPIVGRVGPLMTCWW